MTDATWRNIWLLLILFAATPRAQAQLDRDWKIFVVPFSHVDVGFTAPVETVIQQQSTYLDSVVAYVDRYKTNPEDSRFRWSTEITWPLEDYLATRSQEQIDHFMELVREGYIDIGAMHFSFQTDLAGPEELVRSLYYSNEVGREYSVPIGPAVINDTPGFTWSLAELLAKAENPHLSLAMNSALSDFYKTTDIPNLFYWEAQSGSRTLVWRSINKQWAYLEGSVWGLYGGYNTMESRITAQLNALAASGYPYDFVMINAATGDNGPPKIQIVNNVQAWNDNHLGSTMRVATFSDFFYHAEYASGAKDTIPVLSGDAPNWWSLWFASSAIGGHLTSRKAQALLPAAETAASIASVVNQSFDYPKMALDRAYVDNLLYEDHNMGAVYSGGNEPFWELKMGWVNSALKTAEEVFSESVDSWASQISTQASVEVAVFNVLPWMRSEVVTIPEDHPLLADIRAFEIVDDGTGKTVPHQRLSTGEIAFRADSVPSLGYRTYRLAENTGPIMAPAPLSGSVLENDRYRVEIGETGGAVSVFDKGMAREWALGDGRLNQYRFSGGGPPTLTVSSSDSGAVLQRIMLTGNAPGSASYQTEIRLPTGLKRIDFFNTYDKIPPTTTESVDFVFDFDAPTSNLNYEIPFGHVRVFDDELSGFRMKHYESQRWSTISDETGTAVLSSSGVGLQAYPGGQFNGKVRFLASLNSPNPDAVYRMGLGELKSNFSLTTNPGPSDPALATRAGYDFSVPLSTRLLPRNQTGSLDADVYSFVDVRGGTLQLSTLKMPNEGYFDEGLIGRFYNPSPEPVTVDFVFSGLESFVYEADLLEGVIILTKRGESVGVSFEPYEVKTLLLGIDLPTAIETDQPEDLLSLIRSPYPNPFREALTIRYDLTSPAQIRLTVHDVLGRTVATVVDDQLSAGKHRAEWNGRDTRNTEVAAGVYIVTLEATGVNGERSRTTKTAVRVQ